MDSLSNFLKLISSFHLRFILVVSIVGLFSGCSVVGRVPSTAFNNPEVQGGLWKGRIGLGSSNNTEIVVVNDKTTNPPDRSTPKISSGPLMPDLIFDLGLHEKIDFTPLGLKWQFLGEAHSAGIKGSAFAKFRSVATKTSTSSGTTTDEADVTTTSNQLGLSLGNRIDERKLIYGTLAFSDYKMDTKVQNTSGTFEYTDRGLQYDLLGGVQLSSESWFFQMELGVRSTSYSRLSSAEMTASYSLGFGYYW